jgi:hypothetical protein
LAQQHDVDKPLEGRLFDLLESKGRVRLGTLVQLRRRSRASGRTLVHAALDAGEVPEHIADAIAREVGLAHPRATPAPTSEIDLPRLGSSVPDLVVEDSIDSLPEAFDLGSVDLETTDEQPPPFTPSPMPKPPLPAPRVVGRPAGGPPPPLPILKSPSKAAPGARLRDTATRPMGRPQGRSLSDLATRQLNEPDTRTATRPGFPPLRPAHLNQPSSAPPLPATPRLPPPQPQAPPRHATPRPSPKQPPPTPRLTPPLAAAPRPELRPDPRTQPTLRPSSRSAPPPRFSATQPYSTLDPAPTPAHAAAHPVPYDALVLTAGPDTMVANRDSHPSGEGWPGDTGRARGPRSLHRRRPLRPGP